MPQIVQRHHRAQEIRLSLHQRAADGKEAWTTTSRSPYFVWSVHLDGDKQDARQVGVPGRRLRPRRGGDQGGEGTRLPRQHQLHAVQRRRSRARGATSSTTSWPMGVDGITVSPGYAYERAPDQQHFLNRDDDQEAVPRHLQARQRRQELVVQPVRPVPRFPRRQPDLSLHAVGQPDAHGVRLAEALLSARRRLCQDLQGTDGRHRLGQLRRRQLREMRRLHGALRLRGDRRQ